jgi:hypothetical protein
MFYSLEICLLKNGTQTFQPGQFIQSHVRTINNVPKVEIIDKALYIDWEPEYMGFYNFNLFLWDKFHLENKEKFVLTINVIDNFPPQFQTQLPSIITFIR